MEGGLRGLFVVFSAFMVQVLAFGNYACLGIYTVHLLQEFKGDQVGVSMISSIHFAICFGCGPLVSLLMTKFSYRKLSVVGAALVFIGMGCAPFLVYLPAMYIFIGVFAGLGGCLIYLPSHVLSGMYYDKYRSLATGVATAGTGMGAVVMPLVVGVLIEEYSWKGSMIILAGIDAHLFLFAIFMTPPPSNVDILPRERALSFTHDPRLSLSSDNSGTDRFTRRLARNSILCDIHEFTDRNYRPSSHFKRPVHTYAEVDESNHCVDASEKNSACNCVNPEADDSTVQLRYRQDGPRPRQTRDSGSFSRRFKTSSFVPFDDISYIFQPSYLSWTSDQNRAIQRALYENIPERILETDILSSSLPSLHETAMTPSESDNLSPSSETRMLCKPNGNPQTANHHKKNMKENIKHHIVILLDFKFFIYFLSSIIWSVAISFHVTFVPEVIVTKGHSAKDAAFVMTFYGIGQLVGCVAISILGNFVGKQLLLYVLSNIFNGISLVIVPFFSSYLEFAVLLTFQGLAYGGILGLYMIVTVDFVGVDDMEIGLGYVLLASGIGCFVGPVFGGKLREVYGNYDYSYYVTGAVGVLAGLIMVLIYLPKCRNLRSKTAHV